MTHGRTGYDSHLLEGADEFVEGGELPLRPPLDAINAADFLQERHPDSHLVRSFVDRKVVTSL